MAKRANGEGTIRKRTTKKGSVYWEGRYYDTTTKKQCSIYGKTKEEVRKQLTQKTIEKDNGNFVGHNDITLDMWFESYIKLYKEGVIRPQSLRILRERYTHSIQPYLGYKELQDISDMDIKNMLNQIAEAYTTGTVKLVRSNLKSIFEKAVEKNLIISNPVASIPPIKGRKENSSKRELTDDEISWFMIGIKEKRPDDLLLFQLLLTTGARIGEILGLKWSDFTEDYSYVTISRTTTKYKDGNGWVKTSNEPKTKTSIRTLPILPEIQSELQSWKKKLLLIAKQFNTILSNDDFVFYNYKKDCIYTADYYDGVINGILRYLKQRYNVDIPHFSAHYFRHTFTTNAIRNNVPMEVLKTLLGHSNYTMISRVYAHTSQQDKMNAVTEMFGTDLNIKLG